MVTAEHGEHGGIPGKKWHEQGRMDAGTSTELQQAAGNSAPEDRREGCLCWYRTGQEEHWLSKTVLGPPRRTVEGTQHVQANWAGPGGQGTGRTRAGALAPRCCSGALAVKMEGEKTPIPERGAQETKL